MRDREDRLFTAWREGDERARCEMWELLWKRLYTTAFRFCRRYCRDDATAEECATDAFHQTLVELDRKVRTAVVSREEDRSFTALVTGILMFRCRDRLMRTRRHAARVEPLERDAADADERPAPADRLASPEPEPLSALLTRDGFQSALRLLSAAKSPDGALRETVEGIEEFLRQRLLENGPAGAEETAVGLDELARSACIERMEIDQSDLYHYLQQRLGISPALVYTRMRRVRGVLEQAQRAGERDNTDERSPAQGRGGKHGPGNRT